MDRHNINLATGDAASVLSGKRSNSVKSLNTLLNDVIGEWVQHRRFLQLSDCKLVKRCKNTWFGLTENCRIAQ
jgi:hypothetical protein